MQVTENYPTKKVILYYSLFGGVIGGLLACLVIGLYFGFEQFVQHNSTTHFSLRNIIAGTFTFTSIGWLFGLLPSFITGLILAKLHTLKSYQKPFTVGFLVSFILFMPLGLVMVLTPNNWDYILFLILITGLIVVGLIGGLSSVIVGKLVLPKT